MERTTDISLRAGTLLQVRRKTPCVTSYSKFNTLHLLAGDFVIFLDCSTQSPIPGVAVANVIHTKAGAVACLLEDLRVPLKRNYNKTKMEK